MNTDERLTNLETECQTMKTDIHDIKVNHLPHLFGLILNVYDKVKDLKWFIMGGFALLAVVITLVQLLA